MRSIAASTGSGVWAVAPESRYVSGLPAISRSRIGNCAATAVTSNAETVAMTRSGGGCRLDLLADPAVAPRLERGDELGPTLLHDPALVEHVHVARLDHVEDALVVGDDQHAHVRALERVDAVGDHLER